MKDHLISSPYHAYMLRFWPECQETEHPHWRFTLLDPKTGKQLGFATLESLTKFLSFLTENPSSITEQAP